MRFFNGLGYASYAGTLPSEAGMHFSKSLSEQPPRLVPKPKRATTPSRPPHWTPRVVQVRQLRAQLDHLSNVVHEARVSELQAILAEQRRAIARAEYMR